MTRILIIDDDRELLLLLKHYLKKKGFDVKAAGTASAGLQLVGSFKPDVVLCDYRLPDVDGLTMIKRAREVLPTVQMVMITGYSDVQLAVQCLKAGAFEYVVKPLVPEEILHTIEDATKASKQVVPDTPVTFVSGTSQAARQIEKLVNLVAATDMTVLLLGESGSGKEVTAQQLHAASTRADKPFVALDCGALMDDLAASELFGHERGAFTGASRRKEGVFQQANGGTLFLDEIGNLSLDNQVKLLRVLEQRRVRPVGGDRDVKVDVRLLAATNDKLQASMEAGQFRSDLFYRLNEFQISIPALRHRPEDLIEFANAFVAQANAALNRNVSGFSVRAIEKLHGYSWPGNIRELKNVVKRAVLMCTEPLIPVSCLPDEICKPSFKPLPSAQQGGEWIGDLQSAVARAEKETIAAVLRFTSGNKSRAASILEIDRKTLYNKMHAYEMDL